MCESGTEDGKEEADCLAEVARPGQGRTVAGRSSQRQTVVFWRPTSPGLVSVLPCPPMPVCRTVQ